MSPGKQQTSSFSLRQCLWTTDKDLLVRFLSLGNFQPLSHRPSCCPLSAPHSVLPLAHLGSEQVMLPRQVSLQSIFFKTETMILDQLQVFSLLDQQPHRTSFPFRFLTLLHPFLKRCFCSVSFSALHVEPHHCSARTCRKDQEKTSAAHCRQRKMKETTSSKISWPNATSRSCPFEGTVLERKRERE